MAIELSPSDQEMATYSADVSLATTVEFRMLPASSRTLINLRKKHVKLRPVIPGSQLDEVLAHVGMRPMQQSDALSDYEARHTYRHGILEKSKI
jgi:hypothetical protein